MRGRSIRENVAHVTNVTSQHSTQHNATQLSVSCIAIVATTVVSFSPDFICNLPARYISDNLIIKLQSPVLLKKT